MTYAELLDTLSTAARVPRRDAARVVQALARVLGARVLVNGASVRIPDVGTFRRTRRCARSVRNPVSGERMELPALVSVAFRPAKTLKRKDVTT